MSVLGSDLHLWAAQTSCASPHGQPRVTLVMAEEGSPGTAWLLGKDCTGGTLAVGSLGGGAPCDGLRQARSGAEHPRCAAKLGGRGPKWQLPVVAGIRPGSRGDQAGQLLRSSTHKRARMDGPKVEVSPLPSTQA